MAKGFSGLGVQRLSDVEKRLRGETEAFAVSGVGCIGSEVE